MSNELDTVTRDMMVLSADEKRSLFKTTLQEIPEDKREEALRDAGSLIAGPTQWVANIIWLIIFVLLAVTIVGGALLGLSSSGSDETALYSFVGIALGALVGILAPRPPGVKG